MTSETVAPPVAPAPVPAAHRSWRAAASPRTGVRVAARRRLVPRGVLPSAVLVTLVAYAALVPWLSGVDLTLVDYGTGATGPSVAHWFGTDLAGRDLVVRCAHALRASLLTAAAGALGAVVIGSLVGAACALRGGLLDRWAMRVVDGVNAVPHLLLGIVVAAAFRGSLLVVVMVVALTHWTQTARLVRAELIAFTARDVARAAVSQGFTRRQLLRFHALPRLGAQLGVACGLLVPHSIWHESTLTFLGLGLPPHQPSLGTLLDLSQQSLVSGAWWTLAAPAGLLVVVTLALVALTRREDHL